MYVSKRNPQFTAKDDALEYVESLLIRLLANLTSNPPLTVTDVEVSRFYFRDIHSKSGL